MENDSLYFLSWQQLRTEIVLRSLVVSRTIPEIDLAGLQERKDGRCRLGLGLPVRGEVSL